MHAQVGQAPPVATEGVHAPVVPPPLEDGNMRPSPISGLAGGSALPHGDAGEDPPVLGLRDYYDVRTRAQLPSPRQRTRRYSFADDTSWCWPPSTPEPANVPLVLSLLRAEEQSDREWELESALSHGSVEAQATTFANGPAAQDAGSTCSSNSSSGSNSTA